MIKLQNVQVRNVFSIQCSNHSYSRLNIHLCICLGLWHHCLAINYFAIYMLDQGYKKIRLIRSLKKFIFRYQYLVEIYSVSAEKIISDAFSYSENV